jgi:predicted nucleic acid-binding protein
VNALPGNIFDSSVLSAFCVVGRLDLLASRFSGRAHWTIEVYNEIDRGVADAPHLGDLLIARWLSEPIRSLAVVEIERVRLALGGRPRNNRHRGEAATIVVAQANGYIAAIDDYDATLFARSVGLGTTTTIAILRDCVRNGLLTADDAAALLDDMIDEHDRRLPRVGADELQ